MFSDPKNIEYVTYVLLIISVLVFYIFMKNTNTKKKKNINMVNTNELSSINTKVVIEEKNINGKFSINKVALFFNHKKNIFNPEIGVDDFLIGVEKFFINFQKNFLLSIKEGVLHYTEDEVQMIKKKIWKLDLDGIKSTLQSINCKNNFSEIGDYSLTEGIIKKLIIITIKHPLYSTMDETYREVLNQKNIDKQRIKEKKKNGLELTKDDEKVYNELTANKIIYDELKNKSKKIKVEFLDFCSEKKELQVEVSYKVLFDENYHNFISFYKEKGIYVKTYIF